MRLVVVLLIVVLLAACVSQVPSEASSAPSDQAIPASSSGGQNVNMTGGRDVSSSNSNEVM